MATRKTARKTSSNPNPILIHEYNDKRMHRIVRVHNGKTETSDWYAFGQVAVLDNLRAATDYHGGVLPAGIFTVSQREASVLG